MTNEEIITVLLDARICARADILACDARDGRIAVRLAGDRMAWFPLDEEHRLSMARERRALALIEAHCRFRAPRVIHEDTAGWDVRALVPGVSNPFDFHARLCNDPALARRTGAALGAIVADQQTNIPPAMLGDWLPSKPSWPRSEDLLRIPDVVDDKDLLARIDRALTRADALDRDRTDRVLVHCDLGWHNIAIDPHTDEIAGVFDYEGAAFCDRHQDFKYALLQQSEETLLESMIEIYEKLTSFKIDRDRVRLLNTLSAIGFLGYRFGHPAEEAWCGRTLAEDLAWADGALTAAGF